MKVKVSEIRQMFDKLFDHLEDYHYEEIDLPNDYYWHIWDQERYNVYKKPEDHTIGQISEDMYFLRNMLESEDEPVARYLVKLSAVIRAVGEVTM